MTLLRGKLELHGVDVEKLARRAISDSGLRLSWHREEDLLAHLIFEAWRLSEKHDERRYPGRFSKGCYRILRFCIVDWIRRTEGRTKWQFSAEEAKRLGRKHTREVEREGKQTVVVEHERRALLSLDAPFGSNTDAELGETLPSLAVDAPGSRDEDLRRVLASRHSEAGRPSEDERRATAGRARG